MLAWTIIGDGQNSTVMSAQPTCLHSQGRHNSTDITDCKCNAGYSGLDSACVECAIEKYKSNTGEISTANKSVDVNNNGIVWKNDWDRDCTKSYYTGNTSVVATPGCGLYESLQNYCFCPGVVSVDYETKGGATGDTTYETSVWAQSACEACPTNSFSLVASTECA